MGLDQDILLTTQEHTLIKSILPLQRFNLMSSMRLGPLTEIAKRTQKPESQPKTKGYYLWFLDLFDPF